jgi:hypothetical protein
VVPPPGWPPNILKNISACRGRPFELAIINMGWKMKHFLNFKPTASLNQLNTWSHDSDPIVVSILWVLERVDRILWPYLSVYAEWPLERRDTPTIHWVECCGPKTSTAETNNRRDLSNNNEQWAKTHILGKTMRTPLGLN